MNRFRLSSRSRRLSLGVVVGAVLAAVGGSAYAAIPDPGGLIHGCFNPKAAQNSGATLKVIDSASASCSGGEQSISWGQTGPAGPTGPQGPAGPTGATGPSGTSAGWAASNSQFIDAEGPDTEELVGVDGLPAGSYIVWATIFTHLGDDIVCDLNHGQAVIQPGAPVHYRVSNNTTMTSFVRNAGANSSFSVRCGQTGGDPEAFATIEVIKVDTLQ
jgi:hypothetical protein